MSFFNLISFAGFFSSLIFIFSIIRTLDYPDYFVWSQRVTDLFVSLSTTNLFVEVKIITIISFFGWGRGRWVGGWQKGKPVI